MFAKIKEGKIDFISDKKINPDMIELTSEEYEKILKGFIYNNGEFKEIEKTIEQKKSELKNELEKVTNDLVNINGKIEGAKKLKEMLIFDEDDELELIGYEKEAQELILKRSDIKTKIKELGN